MTQRFKQRNPLAWTKMTAIAFKGDCDHSCHDCPFRTPPKRGYVDCSISDVMDGSKKEIRAYMTKLMSDAEAAEEMEIALS